MKTLMKVMLWRLSPLSAFGVQDVSHVTIEYCPLETSCPFNWNHQCDVPIVHLYKFSNIMCYSALDDMTTCSKLALSL
jgi:hypothetical protein